MNLIARFVFDIGDPVDVYFASERKGDFLDAVTNGKVFHDYEGAGVFFANLSHARYFYIAKEILAPPNKTNNTAEEKVVVAPEVSTELKEKKG